MIELLVAAVVICLTVGIGIVVHELSHAAVLRLVGIPFDITWFPDNESSGSLGAGMFASWARVTPRHLPENTPLWGLRLSALAPLVLTVPFLLVLAGVIPDPVATGNVVVLAVTLGWFACALPSPQDFSVFWHTRSAVAQHQQERN